jgi:nucleoid-associated protein YgaU
MFRRDGTPVRATATISLEEVTAEAAAQNPTSGAREGRSSHVVAEGESLASVAYREYGLASLWRGLAVFNGIDDPMRLAPGTELLLPTQAEATRLTERVA